MAQRPKREANFVTLSSGKILSDLGELYAEQDGILILEPVTTHLGLHMSTLVLTIFMGPKPSARHVTCHRDDERDHNWIENLYWGTRADNLRDAINNGRVDRPKLEDVTELIVREYLDGDSTCILADRYGVTPRAIRCRLLQAGVTMRPKGFQLGHAPYGGALPRVLIYKK